MGEAARRRFGRLALGLALALQIGSVLYLLAALAVEGLNFFSLWGACANLLGVVVLNDQRALLPGLFTGRAAEAWDARLRRFCTLYPWLIGLGALQLILFAFALLSLPGGDLTPNPLAALLLLLGWGAALLASFGTYAALARVFMHPQDGPARREAREWLVRSVIAGLVFAVMNLVPMAPSPGDWRWPHLLPTLLYVGVAALDLALAWFTRRALS